MKKRNIVLLIALIFVTAILGVVLYLGFAINSFKNLGLTHIDANIPPAEVFDSYLKRDLSRYFKEKFNKNVTVKFELLRDDPTQTGIAYPKYYLWVNITGDKINQEGAVRVAAINKESFDVTDYVSLEQIKNNSKEVDNIFPSDISEKIKQKL